MIFNRLARTGRLRGDGDPAVALRSALALAPPEGDLVSNTRITGRLLGAAAVPFSLSRVDWLQLRRSLQKIESGPREQQFAEEVPEWIAIKRATHFWIDGGGMNGTYRNWLEIPARLAGFIAEDDWKSQRAVIQIEGGERFLCGTRLKREYGQWASMSRIELPRLSNSGGSYQNMIIHLARANNSGVRVYELSVVVPNSRAARLWEKTAEQVGRKSSTGGSNSRPYGFW